MEFITKPKKSIGVVLLRIHAILGFIFLFTPILIIIIMSFNSQRISSFPLSGFTFNWYEKLFKNGPIWETFRNSIFIALCSTVVALVVGFCAAYAIVRYKMKYKSLFIGLILAPMLIPAVILGISMLLSFSFFGIQTSILTVILGHSILSLPYTALVLSARLQGFDFRLEEAARSLGANEFQVFSKIMLPNIFPGLIAGALFTFTISLDEFALTFFVNSPSATTLPVKIWTMLRFGITPEINALATIMLIVSFVLVISATRFSAKK
jgi:spermidine/putrescine transport system permease protein